MTTFETEVEANFELYFSKLPNDVSSAIDSLNSEKSKYFESYKRLISLQAWNSSIMGNDAQPAALCFYSEAQNDALASHSLARQGAWRVALMSLRSSIENLLFCLYYIDHPVELRLWDEGKHKLGFTEIINYLSKHPSFSSVDENFSGLATLKGEYGLLSKAVHASAKSFRMTKDGTIEGLNTVSISDLGAWQTRERETIKGLNMVLIVYFQSKIAGAAHPNLRQAISYAVPTTMFPQIQSEFGVSLS